MHSARPFYAEHPMRFGRRPLRAHPATTALELDMSSDVKLFATTFLAGFLFVIILIC